MMGQTKRFEADVSRLSLTAVTLIFMSTAIVAAGHGVGIIGFALFSVAKGWPLPVVLTWAAFALLLISDLIARRLGRVLVGAVGLIGLAVCFGFFAAYSEYRIVTVLSGMPFFGCFALKSWQLLRFG